MGSEIPGSSAISVVGVCPCHDEHGNFNKMCCGNLCKKMVRMSIYISFEKCNRFEAGAEGGALCLHWPNADSCRLISPAPDQK